jgi:hypothetical protein
VVTVAPPATVTIYWAYCSGYNPPVTGNGTITGTSDPTVACNNKKAELGNPSNWVCQGTSAPTAPNCGTAPATPCCQPSYTVFNSYIIGGGVRTCYYTTYYTDPCAGTSCEPVNFTQTVCISCSCPSP